MSYQPFARRVVSPFIVVLSILAVSSPQALALKRWTFYYGGKTYQTLSEAEAAMREANGSRGRFLVRTDADVSRDSMRVKYKYSIEPQPIKDLTPIKYFIDLIGGTFDCGNGLDGCASAGDAIEYTQKRIEQIGWCNVSHESPGENHIWFISWNFTKPIKETVDVWYKASLMWSWGTHPYWNPDLPCSEPADHHSVLKTVKRGYCPPGLPPRHQEEYFPDQTCWSNLRDHITARQLQSCGPTEGNPCSPGTGNKSLSQTDFKSPKLELRRHYNSFDQFPDHSGVGHGWTHSYTERILVPFNYSQYPLHFVDSRGNYERFQWIGDLHWRSVNRPNMMIEHLEDGWVLKKPGGVWEYFSSGGRLLEIKKLDAPVSDLTLSYENGRLASVASDSGRRLGFVYDGDELVRVELPGGGAVRYVQDEQGNLASVEYPDGSLRSYLYENSDYPHALTGIVDELGNRYATYRYDDRGRAISSEHAGGAGRVELSYEADGSTVVRRATGATVRYAFGDGAFISAESIQDPSGTVHATHDSLGKVLTRTDRRGYKTTFSYDRGLVVEKREAVGTSSERLTRYQWNQAAGRRASIEVGDLRKQYEYDDHGRVVERSLMDSSDASVPVRQTRYSYREIASGVERRVAVDGPRLDVSDITHYRFYDHDDADGAFRKGDLWQMENAAGQVTEFTRYDAAGRVTEFRDANGVSTSIEYDPRGRIASRTVLDPATGGTAITRFTYDAAGNLARVTQPDGSFIRYQYDAAHRLVAIEDSMGNRTEYALDAAGQRIGETAWGPIGGIFKDVARRFDSLGRLIGEINGVGDTETHAYDASGNLKSTSDGAGDTTRFQYDALDRLGQTLGALGGVTDYSYDAQDSIRSVTDPRGVRTRYDYDALGNLLSELSPDAGTTTNDYDAAGNRIRSVDARGVLAERDYDVLNRVTEIRYPDSGTILQFHYDQGVNGQGRLTSFTDPTGSTSYKYDYQGNLTADNRIVAGTPLNVGYEYDAAGNRIGMTYPSGLQLTIARDATGRISGISLAGGGANQTIVTDVQYAPFGPMRQLTWGNGSVLTRRFDAAGRLVEQQSGDVQHLTWSYARDGDITAIQDLLNASKSQTFGYDALKRLTHAEGAYGTLDYAYDAVGNRTQLVDNGTVTDYSYASDSNRLLQAGSDAYRYDETGNTVQAGELSLSYNARGRLAQATPAHGKAGQYDYNALGQRVIKTVNHKTTLFAYDLNGHLIGEYDDAGDPIREYVYLNDTPIALLRPKGHQLEVLYIHSDHLGTPKLLTDDKGQVRWEAMAKPFGATETRGRGVELPLRFAGQYFDSEVTAAYNRNRFYESVTDRYLSPDPIGLDGGLNRYLYVEASPLTATDPTGLDNVGCSTEPISITGRCHRICCARHDKCYDDNGCTADSWTSDSGCNSEACDKCNKEVSKCFLWCDQATAMGIEPGPNVPEYYCAAQHRYIDIPGDFPSVDAAKQVCGT